MISSELEIIDKSTPTEFELANLLGEKVGEFVVIYADGKECPLFGTPHASESAINRNKETCDRLNDSGKKSWWPEVFEGRKAELMFHYGISVESTYKDFHPTFTFKVHRVVAGYTTLPHVAFGLLAKISPHIHEWQLGQIGGVFSVRLVTLNGHRCSSEGKSVAEAICGAVVRALRDIKAKERA